MLTEDQITQFQEIYRKHFGKNVSKEEAQDKGIKLVNLMRVAYSPLSKEKFEKLKRIEKNNK